MIPLRNVGVGFAHSLVAYKSTMKGLNKLEVNKEKLHADLVELGSSGNQYKL